MSNTEAHERDVIRSALKSALSEATGHDEGQIDGISDAIERAVFEKYGGENGAYKEHLRHLLVNIKDHHNPTLAQRLASGELSPYTFVHMNNEEMASPERRRENEALRQEDLEQSIGISTLRPHVRDTSGEKGTDLMEDSGQPGLEYEQGEVVELE